jgi:hypothetical protein
MGGAAHHTGLARFSVNTNSSYSPTGLDAAGSGRSGSSGVQSSLACQPSDTVAESPLNRRCARCAAARHCRLVARLLDGRLRVRADWRGAMFDLTSTYPGFH